MKFSLKATVLKSHKLKIQQFKMLREEYKHIYINQEAGTSIMRERERWLCNFRFYFKVSHWNSMFSLRGVTQSKLYWQIRNTHHWLIVTLSSLFCNHKKIILKSWFTREIAFLTTINGKGQEPRIWKRHHKRVATYSWYWHHLLNPLKNGDMPLQEAEQASTRAFCISETIQYNGVNNGW